MTSPVLKKDLSESNNYYFEHFKSNIISVELTITKLKENTFLDRDKYHTTISDIHKLMVKYSSPYSSNNNILGNRKQGVVIVQQCSPGDKNFKNSKEYFLPGPMGKLSMYCDIVVTSGALCIQLHRAGYQSQS